MRICRDTSSALNALLLGRQIHLHPASETVHNKRWIPSIVPDTEKISAALCAKMMWNEETSSDMTGTPS